MSSKPVYQGTYEQYNKLPYEVRKYYAPPVETPQGYEFYSSQTVITPLPENPATRTGGYKTPAQAVAPQRDEVVTFVPSYEGMYVGGGVVPPRKITPSEAKRAQEAYLRGEQPFQSLEAYETTRLTAATTVAGGVTIPVAGAVGVGALVTAEGAKLLTVQKHLTPEEAVTAAGVGVTAGLVVLGVAPYVKRGYNKAMNVLQPERAMYNRVVLSEQVNTPSLSISDRVKGVFYPKEAVAFRNIQEFTGGSGSSNALPKGVSGGTIKPNTSAWVQQQVLVKQTTAEKALTYPMKSMTLNTASLKTLTLTRTLTLPTETKLLPKTIEKTIAGTAGKQQAVLAIPKSFSGTQQQTKNPFLSFAGLPYYRQRSRIEEELAFPISYPAQSPLKAPSLSASLLEKQVSMPTITQLPLTSPLVVPSQTLIQGSSLSQSPVSSTRQAQKLIQEVTGVQQQQQRQLNYPNLNLGGGFGEGRGGRGLWSRWYPRTHNIKSWQAQFGTAGLRVPKAFMQFGTTRKRRRKKR